MYVYPNHVVRSIEQPPPFLAPKRDRRYCEAKIETDQIAARRRHPRAERHRALGLEPDQCGVEATHELDGQALCRRHAGEAALEILLGEQKGGSAAAPPPRGH